MDEAVIGDARANFVKVGVTLTEGVEKVGEARDISISNLGESVDPGIKQLRLVRVQCLVGAEGRVDAGVPRRSGESLVVFQSVGGVVGGADYFHFELLHDSQGVKFGPLQSGVGALPDGCCGGFVKDVVDAEIALQFKVGPVVKGIAKSVGNGAGPCQEFVKVGSVAGAEVFGHSIGTHGAPLVVIAFEPDLEQIIEAAIFGDVFRPKVTVVIDDGLGFGVIVVELLSFPGMEKKIFVDEAHSDILRYFVSLARDAQTGIRTI